MKKFLAILLIALVACEVVEQTNLKRWIDPPYTNPIAKEILKIYQTQGKEAAINYCARYFTKSICEQVINYIAKQNI